MKLRLFKRKKAEQPEVVITPEVEQQIQNLAEEAIKDVTVKYKKSEAFAIRMESFVFEVLTDNMNPLAYGLTTETRHLLSGLIITRLKKHW